MAPRARGADPSQNEHSDAETPPMPWEGIDGSAHQPPVAAPTVAPLDDTNVALSARQALIPVGLKAVQDALQEEVLANPSRLFAHVDGQPSRRRMTRSS